MAKLKNILPLFLILAAVTGCEKLNYTIADANGLDGKYLTVMTYNVYVGGSAGAILSVSNPLLVPEEVGKMYKRVISSDFPVRARAIAKSVKSYRPHLIGLQEVSLIRRWAADGEVSAVLDFLQILTDAFRSEGLTYQVAAQTENIQVEMPMLANGGAMENVRLTGSDVILARSDVAVSRVAGENYKSAFKVERLGLELKRGYAAVDAVISGVTYRFVSTHLEAFSNETRLAQMRELIATLHNETRPVILLGDFNTEAPNGAAYRLLLAEGYADLWRGDGGATCCQDETLRNEKSKLSKRIDHIFVREMKLSGRILTQTLGDKVSDHLPSGIWPSDHAGVIARLPITK